jgi:hypothetical protein
MMRKGDRVSLANALEDHIFFIILMRAAVANAILRRSGKAGRGRAPPSPDEREVVGAVSALASSRPPVPAILDSLRSLDRVSPRPESQYVRALEDRVRELQAALEGSQASVDGLAKARDSLLEETQR